MWTKDELKVSNCLCQGERPYRHMDDGPLVKTQPVAQEGKYLPFNFEHGFLRSFIKSEIVRKKCEQVLFKGFV